jgi:hypothetical protein
MALCGDARSWTRSRAVGDTARAQRTQDGAREDDRNDARGIAQLMRLGLVRALQVDPSAGDACAAHRAQAGAGKTS